jgi:hypothetical protein
MYTPLLSHHRGSASREGLQLRRISAGPGRAGVPEHEPGVARLVKTAAIEWSFSQHWPRLRAAPRRAPAAVR